MSNQIAMSARNGSPVEDQVALGTLIRPLFGGQTKCGEVRSGPHLCRTSPSTPCRQMPDLKNVRDSRISGRGQHRTCRRATDEMLRQKGEVSA